MNTIFRIRPVVKQDLDHIRHIVDEALFPGEMLDELIEPFFSDPDSQDLWFTYEDEHNGAPVGVAYCVHERMTNGTWNLLAIAVKKDQRSKGIGQRMMTFIESELVTHGARLLIVDTSGMPEYDRTRAFYKHNGYVEEARIRNFWDVGDDKITYSKVITSAPSKGSQT